MLSPATYNAVRCLSAMEAAAIECPPDAELGLNMERVSGMISNCNISPRLLARPASPARRRRG